MSKKTTFVKSGQKAYRPRQRQEGQSRVPDAAIRRNNVDRKRSRRLEGRCPRSACCAIPRRRDWSVGWRSRGVHRAPHRAAGRHGNGVCADPAHGPQPSKCSGEPAPEGDGDAGPRSHRRNGRRAEPCLRHPAERTDDDLERVCWRLHRASKYSVRNLPIDHFFRSLADDLGSGAIGVILSGTASDGTQGLKPSKHRAGSLSRRIRSRPNIQACR